MDGEIVAHGLVVERALEIDHHPMRTGYVEAVATTPLRQGRGHGTSVMRAIGDEIRARFELGALGTGSHGFYERLGWETWAGPSSVRTPEGERRTPDDDGYIMILRTRSTPPLHPGAPISCEWRPGDVVGASQRTRNKRGLRKMTPVGGVVPWSIARPGQPSSAASRAACVSSRARWSPTHACGP